MNNLNVSVNFDLSCKISESDIMKIMTNQVLIVII
jgi:hypothetical protein